MLEFTTILFIGLALLFLSIKKDIFHPSFIVCGLWGTLLLIYWVADHPLWDLSNRFFSCIIAWVVPFVITANIFSLRPVTLQLKENHSNYIYPGNTDFFNKIFPFAIMFNIATILVSIGAAGNFSFSQIRQVYISGSLPAILELLLYACNFAYVLNVYALLHIKTLDKKKVALLTFTVLVVFIFKSNKTSFLLYFITLLYVFHKNKILNFYRLILFTLVFVGLIIIVTVNRLDFDFSTSEAIWNFIYIYLISPLTAFDTLINGDVTLDSGSPGSGFFAFLYKVINTFGGSLQISQLGKYIDVPLPTNVFTIMRGPYLDAGIAGIILMSVIQGIFYGLCYAEQKINKKFYPLFYALMVSTLFMQSFGDYLLYSFSTTLQYLIFSVLIARGFTLHFRRYIRPRVCYNKIG